MSHPDLTHHVSLTRKYSKNIKSGGPKKTKPRMKTSQQLKTPSFKMVLTATGEHAYRRPEDGIYVIPIGRLKP